MGMLKKTAFWEATSEFLNNVVLFEPALNRNTTYGDFEQLVQEFIPQLPHSRSLIFIEAVNVREFVVAYISCLRLGHVVYCCPSINDKKTQTLIELYQPQVLIQPTTSFIEIIHHSSRDVILHPNLAVLLSTSGSTGSAKFVKLSKDNIQSNALSIAEYLNLTESEKAFSHLKFHYSYGLSILNSHLAVGASLVLTDLAVTDDSFWKTFIDTKCTSFSGVPYHFESMDHLNLDFDELSSLRYMTQAGGKLAPKWVEKYSKQLAQSHKSFYVMYGQTEASPRISYLPPDMACNYPNSIGIPIPGGEILLLDDVGNEIHQADMQGELAYRGPNVMMGYASSGVDLSSDNTPELLKTGDIAIKNSVGLFVIVGRAKRFIKPFGVRVNLDEVQNQLHTHYGQGVVVGDDERIVFAFEKKNIPDPKKVKSFFSESLNLPHHVFEFKEFDQFPLLENGKYDYRSMMSSESEVKNSHSNKFGARVFNNVKNILNNLKNDIYEVLEVNETHWESIQRLYQTLLPDYEITKSDSFQSLQADSMTFVKIMVELENILGDALPQAWMSMTVEDLDRLYLENLH